MFDIVRRSFHRPGDSGGPGFARPGLPRWLWISTFALVVVILVWHEARTSAFQSRLFANVASRLSWRVEPGASDRIRFPTDGPYDVRLGYTRIPAF